MTAGTEALYPFLTATPSEPGAPDQVLAQVVRSTADKAREIVVLRQEVCHRLGTAIETCARAMAAAFAAGGRLFTFGNGGSSTDAAAVAARFAHPGAAVRPVPATCLTADVALLTALTNDIGFEVVFARQLAALAGPGDVALALSTSGGSVNVVQGLAAARRLGMVTVGLAGSGGGALAESGVVDHLLVIPSRSVHRIQEAQTTVHHVLWELIQRALAEVG